MVGSIQIKLLKETYKKKDCITELIGKIDIPTLVLENNSQITEKWYLHVHVHVHLPTCNYCIVLHVHVYVSIYCTAHVLCIVIRFPVTLQQTPKAQSSQKEVPSIRIKIHYQVRIHFT